MTRRQLLANSLAAAGAVAAAATWAWVSREQPVPTPPPPPECKVVEPPLGPTGGVAPPPTDWRSKG